MPSNGHANVRAGVSGTLVRASLARALLSTLEMPYTQKKVSGAWTGMVAMELQTQLKTGVGAQQLTDCLILTDPLHSRGAKSHGAISHRTMLRSCLPSGILMGQSIAVQAHHLLSSYSWNMVRQQTVPGSRGTLRSRYPARCECLQYSSSCFCSRWATIQLQRTD